MKIVLAMLSMLIGVSSYGASIPISETSSLEISIPQNFEKSSTASPLPGGLDATILKQGDVKIRFIALPMDNQRTKDVGGLKTLHKRFAQKFLTRSVEKTLDQKILKDFGMYVILTDAELVDKPKSEGEYKKVAIGIIAGDNGILTFTCLFDDENGPEFTAIITMLKNGKVVNTTP